MIIKQCFFFTSRYPFGPYETFIENEIHFLSKHFEKVTIFCLDSGKGFERPVPENVVAVPLGVFDIRFKRIRKILNGFFVKEAFSFKKTFRQNVKSLYQFGTAKIIYKRIAKYIKGSFDSLNESVFYSYWFDELSAAMVFLKRRFSPSKSLFVVRAHGSDLYSEANAENYLPLQEFVLPEINHLFPVSNNGCDYLRKKYPNYSNIIRPFRLGTNDYGVGRLGDLSAVTFVTCSNIIPIKNLVLFAKAFASLNSTKKMCWYCIGDGEEISKIREIIESSSKKDCVHFMGRLKNSDVVNFYKHNQITYFVNVSKSEGVPVSIMEAMSFGIPCIATNVGGTSELVNCENGFLLNANIGLDNLKNALISAISISAIEYESMRKNARIGWEKMSSAKTCYGGFYDFIEGEWRKI